MHSQPSFRYVFANGTVATGRVDELEKIAAAFGEKLDVSQFGGSCPKGYYPSDTSGIVKISGMNDYHLRRALLKVTKEYFAGIFKAEDSNRDFLAKYCAMSESQLVNDLFEELKKRT